MTAARKKLIAGRYAGDLASSIVEQPLGLLATEQQRVAHDMAMLEEELRRLELLLRHYRVSDGPDRWFMLALALAREHVPGFGRAQPPGRKPTSTGPLGMFAAYAVVCIDRLRDADPRLTIVDAAAALSEMSPWKQARKTTEALRVMYHRGRKDGRALRLLLNAIAFEKTIDAVGRTEAEIIAAIIGT